jgi:hypothetical protein
MQPFFTRKKHIPFEQVNRGSNAHLMHAKNLGVFHRMGCNAALFKDNDFGELDCVSGSQQC